MILLDRETRDQLAKLWQIGDVRHGAGYSLLRVSSRFSNISARLVCAASSPAARPAWVFDSPVAMSFAAASASPAYCWRKRVSEAASKPASFSVGGRDVQSRNAYASRSAS